MIHLTRVSELESPQHRVVFETASGGEGSVASAARIWFENKLIEKILAETKDFEDSSFDSSRHLFESPQRHVVIAGPRRAMLLLPNVRGIWSNDVRVKDKVYYLEIPEDRPEQRFHIERKEVPDDPDRLTIHFHVSTSFNFKITGGKIFTLPPVEVTA